LPNVSKVLPTSPLALLPKPVQRVTNLVKESHFDSVCFFQ
jgi:hypothetical protein